MNYAACLIAATLVGVDMTVENGQNGRVETYVIGLGQTEVDLLAASLARREPPQRLSCGIDPTRSGGRFVRLSMRNVANPGRGTEPQVMDVELIDGTTPGSTDFLVRLTRDDLEDLQAGLAMEATLPRVPNNVRPSKFVVTVGPGSRAIRDDRAPIDRFGADGLPIDGDRPIRNRNFREPAPRDPIDEDRFGGRAVDNRPLENGRMESGARPGPGEGGRATTLGNTIRTTAPTAVFDYFRERQRASERQQDYPEERDVSREPARDWSMPRRPSRAPYPGDEYEYDDESATPYSARQPRGEPLRSRNAMNRYDPEGYLASLTVPTFGQPTARGPGISRAGLGAGGFQPNRGDNVPPRANDAATQPAGSVLPLAVLGLLLSIGANVFFGWQIYTSAMRNRDMLEQMRFGSWSSESRTTTV